MIRFASAGNGQSFYDAGYTSSRMCPNFWPRLALTPMSTNAAAGSMSRGILPPSWLGRQRNTGLPPKPPRPLFYQPGFR